MKWGLEFDEIDKVIKEELQNQWKIERIECKSQISKGNSGAYVFQIDIICVDQNGSKYSGMAIIKFDQIKYGVGDTEKVKLETAYLSNPQYLNQYSPRVINAKIFSEHKVSVLLIEIASDVFERLSNAEDILSERHIISSVNNIFSDMLFKWNKVQISPNPISYSTLLKDWLQYRINPDETKILHFIKAEGKIDPFVKSFWVLDDFYPNPYLFAITDDVWEKDCKGYFWQGCIHGDLHGKNILFDVYSPQHYYIIDFALYRENTYLLFDQAYFIFSYLLKNYNLITEKKWIEDIKCIASSITFGAQSKENDNYIVINIAKSLNQYIEQLIDGCELKHRKSDLLRQLLLAHIAVGLNYSNKTGIDIKHQRQAFFYAAVFLKELIKFTKMSLANPSKDVVFKMNSIEILRAKQESETTNLRSLCKDFNEAMYKYIFINTGTKNVDTNLIKSIVNIPLFAILDLDISSMENGLHASTSKEFSKAGYQIDKVFFEKETKYKDLNFTNTINWIFPLGISRRQDLLSDSFDKWRKPSSEVLSHLLNLIEDEICLKDIVLIINIQEMTEQQEKSLIYILQQMDTHFSGKATYLFLGGKPMNLEYAIPNSESIIPVIPEIKKFLIAIWCENDSIPDTSIRIPTKNPNGISIDDKNFIEQDFVLVHRDLKDEKNERKEDGLDFYRGNEITWFEIAKQMDIERLITKDILTALQKLFDRTEFITSYIKVNYTMGTGTTTILKRVAWEMKDKYPTLIMNNYSDKTLEKVHLLNIRTGMPAFIIMQANLVSHLGIENIIGKMLYQNIKAIILYVNYSDEKSGLYISHELELEKEAQKFYNEYSHYASDDKKEKLKELLIPNNYRYRLPFFFGLYTFEKDFVSVKRFVKECISYLQDSGLKVLQYIALVTRYSDETEFSCFSDIEIIRLSGYRTGANKNLNYSNLLGRSVKLLKFYNKGVLIVHRVIADEILEQTGIINNNNQLNLKELCKDFINSLSQIDFNLTRYTEEKIYRLFITRDERKRFSDLILEFNKEEQNELFEILTDRFNQYAHLWNHKGRHYMYEMHTNYEDAENCLILAIKYEENDYHKSRHYHTLGLIYRSEINKTVVKDLKDEENGDNVFFTHISYLFNKAEEAFVKSKELDQYNLHAYISYVQLIYETVDAIFNYTNIGQNKKKYMAFLLDTQSDFSRWCMDKLTIGYELINNLEKLKDDFRLHINNKEKFLEKFDKSKLEIGKYNETSKDIKTIYNVLVSKKNFSELIARRFAIKSFLNNTNKPIEQLDIATLEEINNLMNENLKDQNSLLSDLLLWFRTFRVLHSFSYNEAIARFKNWIDRNPSDYSFEIDYYLYILYFMKWYEGKTTDLKEFKEYLYRCKQKSYKAKVYQKYSNEWLMKKIYKKNFPVMNYKELGVWHAEQNIYLEFRDYFETVKGEIRNVEDIKEGDITIKGLINDIFFVPGNTFFTKDKTKPVEFILGFSYSGLRAWQVKKDGWK